MKRHLDLEHVERARRNSVDGLDSESSCNFPEDNWLLEYPGKYPLCNNLEEIQIASTAHMGYSKFEDKTDEKKNTKCQDACNKFFVWKIRFLHSIMAGVLAYVGMQQIERPDAAVWLPLFLVPAGITLISTVDIKYVEGICMKSIVSVYLGSALCLMMWLATSLLVNVAQRPNPPSYNPLDYRQGREMLAVAVCVAWQKFHLFTVKEQAKMTGLPKLNGRPSAATAPREVLKRVVPLVFLPGALAAFCYIESVKPMLVSTTNALQKIVM